VRSASSPSSFSSSTATFAPPSVVDGFESACAGALPLAWRRVWIEAAEGAWRAGWLEGGGTLSGHERVELLIERKAAGRRLEEEAESLLSASPFIGKGRARVLLRPDGEGGEAIHIQLHGLLSEAVLHSAPLRTKEAAAVLKKIQRAAGNRLPAFEGPFDAPLGGAEAAAGLSESGRGDRWVVLLSSPSSGAPARLLIRAPCPAGKLGSDLGALDALAAALTGGDGGVRVSAAFRAGDDTELRRAFSKRPA